MLLQLAIDITTPIIRVSLGEIGNDCLVSLPLIDHQLSHYGKANNTVFKWWYIYVVFQVCVSIRILTLILGSVNEVHMAMSSLVLMSGYLFLAKRASNSCSCCEVKCVLCLLCRLSLTLFLLLLALMSFVSSSWLSGLTGLWLGSSEAGSETWDFKDDRPSDLQFFFIVLY